jgi:hypothetical protein
MEHETHTPTLEPGDNPTHEIRDRTVRDRMKKVKTALGRVGRGFSEFLDASNASYSAASSAMVEQVKEIAAEQREELATMAQEKEEFQLLEQSGVSREIIGTAAQHAVILARQLRKIQTDKPRSDAERRARQATPDVARKNVAIERGVQAGVKIVEGESETPLEAEVKTALEDVLRSVISGNLDDNRYDERRERTYGSTRYME